MFELIIIFIYLTICVLFFWKQKTKNVLPLGIGLLGDQILLSGLIYFTTDVSFEQSITLGTGYLALLVIMFSLSIGPLHRIFKTKFTSRLLSLRRNIGVAGFLLSLAHYLSIWNYIFEWDYEITQSIVDSGSDYGKGVQIGLVLLFSFFVIALISNTRSVKLLKKWWKRIQLLSYPLLVLIAMHIIHVGTLFDNFLLVQILMFAAIFSTIGIKIADTYFTFQKRRK